ncbi:hypothetical protein DFH09DRAFT_1250071 [Mycena vulgaris]|nr:hypothetical protein DFH09DRAFT_1250071 [Mycena vulgaris]
MVVLPQATLPRFLGIASANSARNLETCGLLLGREIPRGDGKLRFVVETLLIPKQHATSDTCTMDGARVSMSSVDLHTHASFQRMLPESFAVVCAPKSDPKYVVFLPYLIGIPCLPHLILPFIQSPPRLIFLSDPPDLQTVLKCTVKQAFHSHPDVPIYTDADRGQVQMRDTALEIVDLR